MGARKRNRADQLKAERKSKAFAELRNSPIAPRKMRLVADLVRGEDVTKALEMLRYSSKDAAKGMEKLVLSAVANWQQKNEGSRIEDSHLYIKEVFVDQSKTLKRIQPAPQGRAYRVRKRSNHVTVVLGSALQNTVESTETETESNN